MLVEMALLCCLIITFRAGVLDPFMDRHDILTFRAGVLDSFVDRLDMLVEMAPLYCLIITFRAWVLHFVMNCLMVLVDILLEF